MLPTCAASSSVGGWDSKLPKPLSAPSVDAARDLGKSPASAAHSAARAPPLRRVQA